MKKLFLFIIFSLFIYATAQAQQYTVEEVSFADIEHIYICHENENFEFRELPINEVLGRNYRNIPHPFDRFFITVSNEAQREPIKFSSPSDPNGLGHPYYVFNRLNGDHSKLYVVIQHRNSLVESCTGRDEKTNTTYIIRDIPSQGRLFITYKEIEEINIESPFGQNIEPANNNGLPQFANPPGNFRPILTPKEKDPEVSSSEDTKTTDQSSETNSPLTVSENDSLITKVTENQVEGCSLQKNSQNSSANWISLIILFITPTLIRIKRSVLR